MFLKKKGNTINKEIIATDVINKVSQIDGANPIVDSNQQHSEYSLKFKEGMSLLYTTNKRYYNYIYEKLQKLNKKLNKYDSKNKNNHDNKVMKELSGLDRCNYLIFDIFDNYRALGEIQIYTSKDNDEINLMLKKIQSNIKMTWFDEIMSKMGLL